MNNILILTSATGEFTKEEKFIEQSIPTDYYAFDNINFPLRSNAMTPRLQARIAKMFGWQIKPGYEFYIWYDNSMEIATNKVSEWYLERLGDADAVFFKHPRRKTVKEEWEFIKAKVAKNDYYLTPRYEKEWGDDAIAELYSDPSYTDNLLIASSTFIMRNNERTHALMKEWWYQTSRYHIVDQLGLPYAIHKSGCKVNILNDNYMHIECLRHTRKAFYKRFWKNPDGTRIEMTEEEVLMQIEREKSGKDTPLV